MPGRADELLRRWAARKLEVPVEEVLSVTFEHEDAWSDDESGTYWPESTTAVVMLAPLQQAHGRPGKNPRKLELLIMPGGIAAEQGLAGFIAEVVAAGDAD